jgi:hypothetical protein
VSVTCRVFVDGSVTGELFTVRSLPRVGERVQLLQSGSPSILTVKSILHVADHTLRMSGVQPCRSTSQQNPPMPRSPKGEMLPADLAALPS